MKGADARVALIAIVLEYRSHQGCGTHTDCSSGRACGLPQLIDEAEHQLGGPEWTRRSLLPEAERRA